MGSDGVAMAAASYGVLALILLTALLALWRSGFFSRLLEVLEEAVFSNWQLALLGATAVALSIASGYTTFDGLRNFTSSPMLSALVAFGIQGVMLIVAWLIGESFATGMGHVQRSKSLSAGETAVGMGLGLALAGLVFSWVLIQYDIVGFTRGAGGILSMRADWQRLTEFALYFATAVVLLALIAFSFRRGGDIAQPYVQSVRLIAQNAVLWVMFLASMSASVFFSFDSHFNGIFPAEARARAAEIRTLNQVAGVVADTGERARKVQIAEAERLFESDAWKAYDAQLANLALAARGAQGEIEAVLVRQMEERQRGIGEQQERIAGAERSQAALLRKRDELEAELQRLEPSMGTLEAELAKAQASHDATKQAIAAKRIDASAEDGGVEGSLKAGKGPLWRQRMGELEELQRKLAIVEEPRLKEVQRQRDLASGRIVGLKREIATVVGELAKYKGQIVTAEHRIKTAQTDARAAQLGGLEPGRALTDFERARVAFRRQPDAEKLAALQTLCGTLAGAMSATTAAHEQVRGIDCDPKSAAEAAARLFALNAGLIGFQESCSGGAKLPQAASTDELLAFGRKCLQDSGLVSKEASDLGARLQTIEMNRDDKAHRFVVSWNAFLDGNRLAYLALALAVGIDALVFTAGLFGAAAARSPLSDLPSPKARSAERLEAIIEAALLPHVLEKARLALGAMAPLQGREHDAARSRHDGFTHEVILPRLDPETAAQVRDVLNAGATIGAVGAGGDDGHYLVRAELVEFLGGMVARRLRGAMPGLRGEEPGAHIIPADFHKRPARIRAKHVPAGGLAGPELYHGATFSGQRAALPATERTVLTAVDVPSQPDTSTPVASGPPLLTDGRFRSDPSDETDEGELRWRIGNALRSHMTADARALAADLTRQPREQRDVRAALARLEREGKRMLDRAARALDRQYEHQAQARQLLYEMRGKMAEIVTALMLVSQPNLFEELIGEAERSGDGELLRQLHALRRAIENMDHADSPP